MNILNKVAPSYQVVEVGGMVHGVVVEQKAVMLLQQIVVVVDIMYCHLTMQIMVILHHIYLLME